MGRYNQRIGGEYMFGRGNIYGTSIFSSGAAEGGGDSGLKIKDIIAPPDINDFGSSNAIVEQLDGGLSASTSDTVAIVLT